MKIRRSPNSHQQTARLAGVALALMIAAGEATADAQASVRRTPVVEAVERVAPAVVNISAESIVREVDPFFGSLFGSRRRRSQSLGSGLVIDRAGVVVTNAHVVEGASRILVTTRDGREYTADVLGIDRDSDLAVLQIDARSLAAVPLSGDEDLLIGETVIAVGNPFGLTHTVTTGVLSARGRSVQSESGASFYTDFLQTDASINPGNSGGPLVNLEGEVIGINTAIVAGADGIGFAIPAIRAQRIVDELLRYGELQPVWIGWRLRTLDPELARRAGISASEGVLIEKVFERSPAAAAGLGPGDVITEVGGQPVSTREQVYTRYYSRPPATPLPVVVERGEETHRVQVAAARPEEGLGLRLFERELGLRLEPTRRGLVVSSADPAGAAAARGIRRGDLVLSVNAQAVNSLDVLDSEMLRALERGGLTLEVGRGRYAYILTFRL